MRTDEWTYADGLRDLALFLLKRLPFVAVAWCLLTCYALVPLANLPNPMLLIVMFLTPLGMVAGAVFGYGVVKHSRLHGWEPTLGAFACSVAVVLGGTLVVDGMRPFASSFDRALTIVCACIGAGAAVARTVMLED